MLIVGRGILWVVKNECGERECITEEWTRDVTREKGRHGEILEA